MAKCPKCNHVWFSATRSKLQNSYYWFVLDLISEETGDDPESLHEYFKKRFNSEVRKILNDEIKIVKSTACLKTGEFKSYIEKIIMFASKELSIVVPDPKKEQDNG